MSGTTNAAAAANATRGLRPRPLTCLADADEVAITPAGRFADAVPEAERSRTSIRKWWEWDYLATCADALGLLDGRRVGIGLGAGTELLIYYFARHCRHVTATDLYAGDAAWPDAKFDDFARAVVARSPFPLQGDRIEVRNADMRALPVADASMDFVWSCSSIEHVPQFTDLLAVFSELARVLRPGGYALLTTEYAAAGGPYLLPGVNAMDAGLLPALLGAFGRWLEPVGPTDLAWRTELVSNGTSARRYPMLSGIQHWHERRNAEWLAPTAALTLDPMMTPQMGKAAGLASLMPVGFVLRRTTRAAGAVPTLAALRLPARLTAYCDGIDAFMRGENGRAAGILDAIAGDATAPLQSRLHAFRYAIDARLRDGMSLADAAERIERFLACVPPRALDDDDCGDLFSYVMKQAGRTAEAAVVARAGALSPSCTWEHAIRLGWRADVLNGGASLMPALLADLVRSGWEPAPIAAESAAAAAAEGADGAQAAAAWETAMRALTTARADL